MYRDTYINMFHGHNITIFNTFYNVMNELLQFDDDIKKKTYGLYNELQSNLLISII